MAERTKLIEVKGHYRMIPDHDTGRFVSDPDNPSNEAYVVKMKKVWILPYKKAIKYDDGT